MNANVINLLNILDWEWCVLIIQFILIPILYFLNLNTIDNALYRAQSSEF